jgi:phosphatidylserine decarboxylase
MTPAGEAAFRLAAFNDAIRAILKEWCAFLDSPQSRYVLNETAEGWLSQPAYEQNKLYEFVIPDPSKPHGGFPSFNAYFHRQIKPEFRPVSAPKDPKVIVSANDGTVVTYVRDVQPLANFWLKGQPYSLVNMLAGSKFTERFFGGDVFQSFLSGADYHRWHSPIDGVVRSAEVIDGLMFSDAESAGPDPTAATYSQGYEASVNTRGLVFVEGKDPIGMVCVMPIGITEISSITIEVKPGDRVKKGDELGYFSYGGSSLCLVFQKGAIDRFTVPQNTSGNQDDGPPIYVNAEIAIAK